MNDLDALLGTRPASIQRDPVTAQIVRVDATGIWAVPLGGDTRYPIGPCQGPTSVTVGTTVLLTWTRDQPWINGGSTDHESSTLDVHGIPDTAELETQAGAQAKADAAATGAVATHAGATLNVHGIPDTALLETQAGAQAKITAAIDALVAGAPGTLDTLAEIAVALQEDDDAIAALTTAIAAKETPDGAQAKADAAADAAVAAHDTAKHGDTGTRIVVAAGGITDLPDLEVLLRRVGPAVSVWTREATAATHTGAVALYTLPTGFRPLPAAAAGLVLDPGTGIVTGSHLSTLTGGAMTLTATSGARHHSSLTYVTADAWPTALPGTPEV